MAGDQLPEMPLFDVAGRSVVGIVDPLQYGPTDANVGVTLSLITICKVVGVEHCPAVGVNV